MHAFRNLPIRGKLIGIIMLTSMMAILLACATFVTYESVTYQERMGRHFVAIAQIVVRTSAAALEQEDSKAGGAILAALQAEPQLVSACLYTKQGRLFASYLHGESWKDLPLHPEQEGARIQNDHLVLFQRVTVGGELIGTVYMKRDLKDVHARFARYGGIVVGVLLFSSLVIFYLSSVLERLISEPILRLAETAGRVSTQKDYSVRAAKRGNDEIGVLVDRFNEMMAHIEVRSLDLAEAQRVLERQVGELCDGIAVRQRVEEEMLAAQQAAEESNRAKSAFLANMSHELRTPLNAIIGYSEMLSEEAQEGGHDECVRDLARITAAGRHLLTLINEVLDLSKVEAGKTELVWEDVPVARIAEDAVEALAPLARKNNNKLIVNCAPDLPAMHVDVVKFRQSLYNLLSNACKFTENGTVALDVNSAQADGAVWIEWRVSDTGVGIASDQIRKLFQPFTQVDASTTRKYGGTGLGLAISQRFCGLMGGTIDVASEPGKGSTFTMRLPYAGSRSVDRVDAPLEAAAPPVRPRAHLPQRNTILVIDDDPTVHDLMARSLTKDGFDVVVASSGLEGLRKAREVRPAAITLDVYMPGMNGWAVLNALKTDPDLADIPVILLTIADDRGRACLLGAAEFLQKPIEPDRLIALLQRYQAEALGGPVLVIDDDLCARDMAVRVLRKHHFGEVIEAADGQAALDCMSRQKPGLILLDLMMPGMDGFDFIGVLRQVEEWREIPIVVLTAKEISAEDRVRLSGSVQRIVQKGDFDGMALATEIADLLRGRPRGPAEHTVCVEKD